MEVLAALALLAGLLLPSWRGRDEPASDGPGLEEAWTVEDEQGDSLQLALRESLFSAAHIRHRLDALTEELERLDRDPDVFAKAFHTLVAREAYEALLADAAKVRAPAGLEIGALEFELLEPSAGSREELDL